MQTYLLAWRYVRLGFDRTGSDTHALGCRRSFIMARNVDRCQIKLISIMYIWAAKASVRRWAKTVVQTEKENYQQRRSRKETRMSVKSDPRQALQRKLSTMNPG